ncbi:MAG: hypothetical protein K2H90_07760, partial [Oscillospiraceae bacterium]|nr:hypothetical protein [Oscillospiraceae bacterium]
SETIVTATADRTASEAVSKETEIIAEVSATDKKVPVTRDFFNDDVVFEEVMVPVKETHYNENGTIDYVHKYEYDAAGNQIVYESYTTEYDYNKDGTYNSITMLFKGSTDSIRRFDENGYCIESYHHGITDNRYKYEYEFDFDEAERLIRKTKICAAEKVNFEYTYDENGRVYEEFNTIEYYSSDRSVCNRYKHEYGDGFEKIYYLPNGGKEELYKTTEKDENGNIIKETLDHGVIGGTAYGYRDSDSAYGYENYEYKYDDLNRLIYKKSVYPEAFVLITNTTEYFYDEKDRLVKELITVENGTGGNEITHSTLECIYNDNNGSMLLKYNDTYSAYEKEYAMIPKIKTDIEYKYFEQVEP